MNLRSELYFLVQEQHGRGIRKNKGNTSRSHFTKESEATFIIRKSEGRKLTEERRNARQKNGNKMEKKWSKKGRKQTVL